MTKYDNCRLNCIFVTCYNKIYVFREWCFTDKVHNIYNIIYKYGADILGSENMELEKHFIQHGSVSVYQHSLNVTVCCVRIADKLPFKVNMRSLVRGALLHDYFLYDWHVPDKSHRLHGFRHANFAFKNASAEYPLNSIEADMIKRHMFPLNPVPPRYIESAILCTADKFCALKETLFDRS